MKLARVWIAAACAPLLCAQNAGSISGRVTNSVTGAGVEGVKVRAACLGGASTHCPDGERAATTDAAGAFRIPGLPDARYWMSVQRDGFSLGQGALPVAAVSASGDFRIDLKMTPSASLSGRVVDPGGKPVAGITVDMVFGRAITDDQGAFVFHKLNPGAYRLLAKVKAQADGKDGERLVNTYFPSAIYAEQAVSIQVQGVDLTGYEIRLRTAPARTVRGVLLDADGKPKSHVQVTLNQASVLGIIPMIRGFFSPPRLQSEFPALDRTESAGDGVFEFPAVLEGDWILKAYDTVGRQGGSADVRVGHSNIEDAALRLARSFPIEVSPQWTDPQASDPAPSPAWIVPMDGQVSGNQGTDAGPPFASHRFGLPGRYLFGPGDRTPGYYVSAVMLNGHDVMGQVAELDGPADVQIVLTKGGGTVRGTVEKGGGSTVILMADASGYARFGLSARCDPEGNFSISEVPPGNYTAIAFQDREALFAEYHEVLNRIASARGERVKVDDGGSENVLLKLN